MAMEIEHNLEVDAPPETVWEVITDMAAYPEWNPFVLACESTLQPGDPINMTVRLGNNERGQVEIITEYDEGKGFAYKMKSVPLGALSSYRTHRIEDLGGGQSRYVSRFQLLGWLSPLVKAILGGKLEAGFSGMSEGVRERAQSLTRSRQQGS